MDVRDAIARVESWEANPRSRPAPDIAKQVAGCLVAEVQRLSVVTSNQEAVMKAAHGTSGRIKATAIKLGWSAERDEPPLDYLIERAQAAAVARAGGKTSVIEWKADPSELRAVIEKYVAQRDKALAKQTHVDARQCIYYAAGGALTAIFEALGTFLKQMRPSDRAQVKEVHGLMQLALDHYRETEGRRVAEARAFESQNVETLTAASNDPVAPE